MIQRTFPVNIHRPEVIIANIHGRLHVQPWQRQEIYVEAAGEVGTLKQEEKALLVADCWHDLVLRIPAMTALASTVETTNLVVNNVRQGASISGAGNVVLTESDGDIFLRDICGNAELASVNGVVNAADVGGNLYVRGVPRLDIRYVGGDAMLADTEQVNLCAVGGSLRVSRAENVSCGAVGSDLEAEHIKHDLRCRTVGGHCTIRHCAEAKIDIHSVGEDFVCAGAVLVSSGVVGGDLHLQAHFPAHSHLFYHIGGNAHLVLPARVELTLNTTVGGNAQGPLSTYVRNGGFITLLYGEGSTHFDLVVDGNVILAGAEPDHGSSGFSWDEFGQWLAAAY